MLQLLSQQLGTSTKINNQLFSIIALLQSMQHPAQA